MRRFLLTRILFTVALLAILLGGGCAPASAPTAADVLDDAERRYQQAIAIAETLGVAAIRPLTPVTAEAPTVQWQGPPGNSRVRVV
ncbi:MAG: hypothetical protein GVY12_14185, partial [Bacteroidetes bacterium]|nr:hypothetical protein [Bacteroidota bacterium]